MATEEERRAEAEKFRLIDDAFHRGDLEVTDVRIDRHSLVAGLFYGVEGVGGTRRLEIAPHLAYGIEECPG
jgi:FKBP-type peptidyl-prolyl cis-trans isomerase